MRHFYIISIICLLFFQLNAQNRFPLQSKSVWRVDLITYDNRITFEEIMYFTEGDTAINSYNYYKLYKSGVMTLDGTFYYKNIYVGAIRDSDNKIIFIDHKTLRERLLYDFNLNVGDTIKSEVANGLKILSIDTMQDGRKKFNYIFNSYDNGYLIEGIGNNGGLFTIGSIYQYTHLGMNSSYLVCYSENGILKYRCRQSLSTCDIPLGVDAIDSLTDSDIKVYPVPTNGMLYIESTEYGDFKSVGFYSIMGKQLFEKNTNENRIVLNLSEFRKGIYILIIKRRNTLTTHRIIKV